MKKTTQFFQVFRWAMVLIALTVAVIHMPAVTGVLYILCVVGVGLACVGLAEEIADLLKKPQLPARET